MLNDSVVTDVPPPEGRDLACRDWLRYMGIHDRTAVLRSSALTKYHRDPFLFYLTERLGLVDPFAYSEALSRGSWVHTLFEMVGLEEGEREVRIGERLQLRLQELNAACQAMGIIGDTRNAILERERQDARVSAAWYGTAMSVPVPGIGSFQQYLLNNVRILAHECRLYTESPYHFRSDNAPPMVAQLDALALDPLSGGLWIIDLKTTGKDPKERMATCPVEIQTWHYAWITQDLLNRGVLQAHFGLPDNTPLLGFLHLVMRKPTIELCGKDRAYRIDTTPLRSGPRKGEPRNEKIYYGEPLVSLYTQRVVDWYLGRGEHLDLRPQWDASPPVNASWTKMEALGLDDNDHDYYNLLSVTNDACLAPAIPQNFSRVLGTEIPEKYLPFYLSHPRAWPGIIQEKGFVQKYRDGNAGEVPPSTPRVELH